MIGDRGDKLGQVIHLEVERKRRRKKKRMTQESRQVGSSGRVGIEHHQENRLNLMGDWETVCLLTD